MLFANIYSGAPMTTTSTNFNRGKLPAVLEALPLNHDQQNLPLKIYTFGRFGLVRDGIPLHFSGKIPRKPIELLKVLIAFGGRGVSEERMTDHLWPCTEIEGAKNSLSAALHRLRRLLGGNGFIQRQDGCISIDPDFCWVDAWAFERLSKQAQSIMQAADSPPTPALRIARQAIAYYTGPFLPTDTDKQWSISMREKLRDKMRNLITLLGQHQEASGDWHAALATYQKGIEADDLHEDFYQRQIICLCQLGNCGEAASVYHRCRCALAMHGVKPSPITTNIYESAIFPTM